MAKIFENNCIECNKNLVSRYAKRCIFCAAKFRVSNPLWREKQSDTKKGKIPKNLASLRWIPKMIGKHHSEETRKKMSLAHKGEKSYLWEGGKTKINNEIRRNVDYRIWRELVFKRDNYICQLCGIKGKYIQADHIKPFAYYPELRFELLNGRTLCIDCHKKTDTYMGRAVKINKQLYESCV